MNSQKFSLLYFFLLKILKVVKKHLLPPFSQSRSFFSSIMCFPNQLRGLCMTATRGWTEAMAIYEKGDVKHLLNGEYT